MTDILDYYDLFELDRSMDEKQIKKTLGKKQAEVIRLQGSTSRDDTVTLKELQQTMKIISDAIHILSKPELRKKYDIKLDKAKSAGEIHTEHTEEIKDVLKRAKAFYDKGQYELAIRFANQAIQESANEELPYAIICRSHFMLGDYDEAVQDADRGAKAFNSSMDLQWLRIHFRIMMEEYQDAQALLNSMLERGGSCSLFYAEQAYLYVYSKQDQVAERYINQYIQNNPTDTSFKKYVAYDLVEVAQQSYLYDSNSGLMVITEKESYKRALLLTTLANQLYQDDYICNELQKVNFLGHKEYDQDHDWLRNFYIGATAVFGVIALLAKGNSVMPIMVGIAAFCAVLAYVVVRTGYLPYWQICRDEYRGFKDSEDGIVYNLLLLPVHVFRALLDQK